MDKIPTGHSHAAYLNLQTCFSSMDVISKARVLGDAGKYDVCGGEICKPPTFMDGLQNLPGIIKTRSEGGRFCSLLKTLQTNSCKYDCKYCANRAGSNAGGCQRKITSFEPQELAGLFNVLVQKRIVTGLFLSSGIVGDADKASEKMLQTVRLVRHKYHFNGYIHFKILPGTSFELVKQASELASRLSINVEAPSKSRLSELSTVKEFKSDILRRQLWISRMKLSSGQTTQIIAGAGDETDLEIIKMARWEYEKMSLKRCYYSSFSPVKGTPLENKEKVPVKRSNRLYNVDWLLRIYKYDISSIKEVLVNDMLPDKDPKLAIAEKTLTEPVNINDASYEELIRVPGIGLQVAQNILAARENRRIDEHNLRACGAVLKRAGPFIRVNGEQQKSLLAYN
jgi:predicted DNA-binding helix-hairpin-helix protein